MKCLVTGAAGFAGSHLAALLVEEGHEVVGVAAPGEPLDRLEGVKASVRTADITDAEGLADAVASERFDCAFHLAAIASVPATLSAPEAAFRVNALGTVNVLETLRRAGVGRVVYVSSADVYGHVRPDETPVRETRLLKPSSPYAASKAAAEVACRQFWRTFGVPVVILRPFNHTGPSQGLGFAPSDFASAIARIERGEGEPRLAVGNLQSRRDYCDVRDIARAYLASALRCEPGRPTTCRADGPCASWTSSRHSLASRRRRSRSHRTRPARGRRIRRSWRAITPSSPGAQAGSPRFRSNARSGICLSRGGRNSRLRLDSALYRCMRRHADAA